jgi:ferritin-like metal-binding protein YciE
MLEALARTTDDPELKNLFERHHEETERQAERLRERLEAHDSSPSMIREAGGILGATMKGIVDVARPDDVARNARDAFASEQLEIASYELLERVAHRAGDEATAEVARQNRQEEEEMARRIAAHWDHVVDALLADEGVVRS